MRALAILCWLLPASVAAAAAPTPLPLDSAGRPSSQVLFELGWALPGGDLGDSFNATELGFGADDGLEVGFRWRFHLNDHVSLAPAFHFVDYGNFTDVEDPDNEVTVQSSTYRYTLELRYGLRPHDSLWQPFATVGAGLHRNRVQGWTKDYEEPFVRSVNTFGFEAGLGLRLAQFEFRAVRQVNRFSTWQLFPTGIDQEYDWSSLVLRGGWIIPFGEVAEETSQKYQP